MSYLKNLFTQIYPIGPMCLMFLPFDQFLTFLIEIQQ